MPANCYQKQKLAGIITMYMRMPVTCYIYMSYLRGWGHVDSKCRLKSARNHAIEILLLCFQPSLIDNPDIHISAIVVDCPSDVSLVTIYHKRAIMDQLEKGAHIYISGMRNDLYLIAALLVYLEMQNMNLATDGTPLLKTFVVRRVRKVFLLLGYVWRGHSIRIGAVTMAVQVGVDDVTI